MDQKDRIERFFQHLDIEKSHKVSEKKQTKFFEAVDKAFHELGIGGYRQAHFDYEGETGVFCILIQQI